MGTARKTAFVTEAFLGSILPLARQYCRNGYAVDIYYLRDSINEPEGCECTYTPSHNGLAPLPDAALEGIRRFIGGNGGLLNIILVPLPRPFHSVPLLRQIASLRITRAIKGIAAHIDRQGYEMVNIVANYDMMRFTDFLRYIKTKTILSLHEVWNHANPSPEPSRLLACAFRQRTPIVVYSKKSLGDIRHIKGVEMSRVRFIPFGLFDSYGSITPVKIDNLPTKYFLFYGYILPYKGLDVLAEAVKLLGDKLHDYKIIIAGRGSDPVLDAVTNDNRYLLLRRFISNNEMPELIGRAEAVVCPYHTMSQSGIPQTSFVFRTPVIASDLDGFKEIVTPDNGMLFTVDNAQALADCMEKYINNKQKRVEQAENIAKFYTLHPQFSWTEIFKQYKTI